MKDEGFVHEAEEAKAEGSQAIARLQVRVQGLRHRVSLLEEAGL
jgi:hypothetical protein